MVSAFLGLLWWHAAPALIAVILWWQLRNGVIWVYFGIHSAKRSTEPVAYWLGIVGTCFALLVAGGIVGAIDVAILRNHGWL